MADLLSRTKTPRALDPIRLTDNTVLNTAIIDRAGADSLMFAILLGTLADADATFAVTLTAGDDSALADGAAPASTELVGTLANASFDFSADNTVRRIGYIGIKRYVKLTITPTNNTGNADISVLAVLGSLRTVPNTTQVFT